MEWFAMKVLVLKTDERVTASQIAAQRHNEIQITDIKRLIPGALAFYFPAKISRLAYLYIMFAEKDADHRPVNRIASALLQEEDAGVIRGDVVIARTDHLGIGAKFFSMEDDEIQNVVERMTKILGHPIVSR